MARFYAEIFFPLHSEGRVKLCLGEMLEIYCTFLLLLERTKGASKRIIKYISTVSQVSSVHRTTENKASSNPRDHLTHLSVTGLSTPSTFLAEVHRIFTTRGIFQPLREIPFQCLSNLMARKFSST